MSSAPPNPHDAVFRAVFRTPRYAAGLLRIVLPPELAALLRLESVEVLDAAHVDPELRGTASDIVLRVGRVSAGDEPESVFMVVAVEHQSRDEHLISFRLLQYKVRIWEGLLREEPNLRRLPPVIPVVVHTGLTPWRSPVEFHDVVDLPPAPLDALVRPFVAGFRMVLEDLAVDPIERLRSAADEPISETVLEIMQNARRPVSEALLVDWVARLSPLASNEGGRSTLLQVLWYLLYVGATSRERVISAADQLASPVREDFMTTAEQFVQWGLEQGLEKGLEQGRQEGQRAALAATLLRLIERRFGPASPVVAEQVRAASVADLERWLDGILTAAGPGDLFQ